MSGPTLMTKRPDIKPLNPPVAIPEPRFVSDHGSSAFAQLGHRPDQALKRELVEPAAIDLRHLLLIDAEQLCRRGLIQMAPFENLNDARGQHHLRKPLLRILESQVPEDVAASGRHSHFLHRHHFPSFLAYEGPPFARRIDANKLCQLLTPFGDSWYRSFNEA